MAVIGTLKGYDQLMNLVLDEVKEALTGMCPLRYIMNVRLTSV
jgi:small nuclear ribonucleoprotein (snRNP)-like protein